jgi:glucose-6-phosphate 1-dehydrogenase
MNTEKFRNACEAANQVMAKINTEEFSNLQSKLEYCIGSYDHDKNPTGLIEYGSKALNELKAYKVKNPRKVNAKIISDLEKNLA